MCSVFLHVNYRESHVNHHGMKALSQVKKKFVIVLKEKQKEVVLAMLNGKRCALCSKTWSNIVSVCDA